VDQHLRAGHPHALFGNGSVPYISIIDGEMVLQYTTSGFYEPQVIATIEQLLNPRINHVPLKDTEDNLNPYSANCSITSCIRDRRPISCWNLDGLDHRRGLTLGGDDYGVLPSRMAADLLLPFCASGRSVGDPSSMPPTGTASPWESM
jgi:hypothetical protein